MASEGHARGSAAYRRLTLALLFAGFATFSLLYAPQPLLPLFAAQYGLSAEAASLVVSAATGPLAIGILLAGGISDRWGRRPLMVAAMFAGAMLTLAAAAAPGWWALLALRVLAGLALAGVPAVAMAYVAEEVDAPSVGAAMGLYIAGSALGGMGGRLTASVIADLCGADTAGWRWALGGVGLVGLGLAEAFRRFAPASQRFVPMARRVDLRALFADRALVLLYGEAFVLMGVFVTVYNYVGFRLLAPPYELSQAAVGAVFLLYLSGSASSAWFGALAGRAGRARVLPVTILLLMAGTALTLATPLPLVVLGIGVMTVGFFGAHSIASAWVGVRMPAARGQAAAWYLLFYYAGSSLLGSAGGIAWSSAGWPGVAWFCLVLGGLALTGAVGLMRLRDEVGA